ncbi:MAG: hypothetical protein AAFP17_12485 [Pseudomonadota bacterium]
MRGVSPRPERAMKLRVREEGQCVLAYQFRSSDEAAEVYRILRDYFPKAQFVFEQGEPGR